MKRWIYGCLLVFCASTLFACGNQTTKQDTYTSDAQVEEHEQKDSNIDKSEEKAVVDEVKGEAKSDTKSEQKDTDTNEQTPPPSPDKGANTSSSTTTPPPVVNDKPVESERIQRVTISIDTKTIANNMDKVAQNKRAYVPSDGWILAPITVEIQEGDTVFDVLLRVTQERRIHMEYQGVNQNIYDSVYIQGIGQLYEFDCGELSGWMYTIDGSYVSKGASAVKVNDGMNIEWRYTCDLGRDLGL